jgi:hypothetical protein
MADLKLAKLPDRTPVKLTIFVTPDLSRALNDYATLYHDSYGQKEAVAELVPHMLATFLAGDRAFVKARERLSRAGAQSA